MSTRRTHGRFRPARTRPPLSALAVLALAAAALPGCTLERGAIGGGPPAFQWTTAATIRTAEGVAVRITGDDHLFSGGRPRGFFTTDTTFGDDTSEARVRAEWRRYLRQQLADPAASPEFRAVFGDGPWCLVDDEARRTSTPLMGAFPPPVTGDELAACTGTVAPVSDCPTGAGTMPRLDFSPPAVTFAPAPAGTPTPEEQILTIVNAGDGRLCLAPPIVDPSESERPEHYRVDATDCEPRSPREMELGRALLWTDRPSCQVRITFAPATAAPGGARLRLDTNDPRPMTFVDISGTPIPGVFEPESARVCFDGPFIGSGCRRSLVRVQNRGPGAVTVRSVSVPPTAAGWVVDPLILPARIASGGTLVVSVRACSPSADSVLTVASDATVALQSVALARPGACP